MRNQFILIFTILLRFVCNAQQDAQYSQYMYNTILVNPAYAGSREAISIFAQHRSQWVGMDGAPVTNCFSVNAPIGESKLGVGLNALNDRIGPTDQTYVSVDLSYYFYTSTTYKLAFGLKGTSELLSLNTSSLTPYSQIDPKFQGYSNSFSPNIGSGIYFYSNKMYVGLSVPNLLETNAYDPNQIEIYKRKRNVYAIAGYVFELNDTFKCKPTLLFKYVGGAPLQIDTSINFLAFDKFLLGAAYRVNAAFSGLAGFQASKGFFIGYGYDIETTALSKQNSGSHEIFIRYEFTTKTTRMIPPRFF